MPLREITDSTTHRDVACTSTQSWGPRARRKDWECGAILSSVFVEITAWLGLDQCGGRRENWAAAGEELVRKLDSARRRDTYRSRSIIPTTLGAFLCKCPQRRRQSQRARNEQMPRGPSSGYDRESLHEVLRTRVLVQWLAHSVLRGPRCRCEARTLDGQRQGAWEFRPAGDVGAGVLTTRMAGGSRRPPASKLKNASLASCIVSTVDRVKRQGLGAGAGALADRCLMLRPTRHGPFHRGGDDGRLERVQARLGQ